MCKTNKTNKLSHALRMFSVIMLMGLFGFNAAGQTGEIRGTVTNDKGDALEFAIVRVTAGGLFVTGVNTDFEGKYSVTKLEPGMYDVEFSYSGHHTKKITAVSVGANKTAYANPVLTSTVLGIVNIETEVSEKPIVEKEFSSIKTLDLDQIENIAGATGDIRGMVTAIAPDVLPTSDGKGLYMRGARANATALMIDGVRVIGSSDIPSTSIGGLMVLTGGVPAEYGDFTGGLVVITTKSYTQGIREKRVRNFEAKEKKKEKMEAEAQQKRLEREQKKLEQQN